MSECEVTGCDRIRRQRGLCNAHWLELQRTGQVTLDARTARRVAQRQAKAEREAIHADARARLAVLLALLERCRRLRAGNLEDCEAGSLLEAELANCEAGIRACLRALAVEGRSEGDQGAGHLVEARQPGADERRAA